MRTTKIIKEDIINKFIITDKLLIDNELIHNFSKIVVLYQFICFFLKMYILSKKSDKRRSCVSIKYINLIDLDKELNGNVPTDIVDQYYKIHKKRNGYTHNFKSYLTLNDYTIKTDIDISLKFLDKIIKLINDSGVSLDIYLERTNDYFDNYEKCDIDFKNFPTKKLINEVGIMISKLSVLSYMVEERFRKICNYCLWLDEKPGNECKNYTLRDYINIIDNTIEDKLIAGDYFNSSFRDYDLDKLIEDRGNLLHNFYPELLIALKTDDYDKIEYLTNKLSYCTNKYEELMEKSDDVSNDIDNLNSNFSEELQFVDLSYSIKCDDMFRSVLLEMYCKERNIKLKYADEKIRKEFIKDHNVFELFNEYCNEIYEKIRDGFAKIDEFNGHNLFLTCYCWNASFYNGYYYESKPYQKAIERLNKYESQLLDKTLQLCPESISFIDAFDGNMETECEFPNVMTGEYRKELGLRPCYFDNGDISMPMMFYLMAKKIEMYNNFGFSNVKYDDDDEFFYDVGNLVYGDKLEE